MLSVLVWLAIQLPYNSVDCDPQMRNGKEYQQCAVDAPAEHVIEVKTRREEFPAKCKSSVSHPRGTADAHWFYCICQKNAGFLGDGNRGKWSSQGFEAIELDGKPYHSPCMRVTRELWIDGVRWGVVKGLD